MSLDEAPQWFLRPDAKFVYRDADYLVLDFETTNKEKGTSLNKDNKLVLACWVLVKDGVETKKHKFGDEYEQRELLEDIKKVKFIVAHNIKFEAQWLKRCGVELRDILMYDTFLGQWVLDGNLSLGLSLDDLALRYGRRLKMSLVSQLIKNGVCPSSILPSWLLKYCAWDVDLCHSIFREQVEYLHQRNQLHLVHQRNLTALCLADIEFNGMFLDKERVQAEYDKTSREHDVLGRRLEAMSPGVNWSSPKQLATFLYDELGFDEVKDYRGKPIKTATGARSTGAEVLSKLVPRTDKQKEFLEVYRSYNKLDSLLSKNLVFFEKVCRERNGVFYGEYNQGRAASHRLTASGRKITFSDNSSHSVQYQNMPRQYKYLFCSGREDWLIGNADGAQLEFRVAADLGKDKTAYDSIVNGEDVHAFTAKILTENGFPVTRQEAKAYTFKPLYGGTRGHKAVVDYCEAFRAKYQGIATTQSNWTIEAFNNKKLRTPYGMIFYWPDIKMNRGGHVDKMTEIYNYPVQGFATAEIIPIALVFFWHRTRNLPVEILNTIHDSIISRFHYSVRKEYEEISKHCLTHDVYNFLRDVYNYTFTVPLGVGVKIGTHWDEAEVEQLWSVWPDGKEEYKEKH